MNKFFLITLLSASVITGMARKTRAENPVKVGTYGDYTYVIDLDNRDQYFTESGWRHVRFRLSTSEDTKWHSAIAACNPYDVQALFYEWDWKTNGGGYEEGTAAGDIARAACDW